jgi:hypothetical protein
MRCRPLLLSLASSAAGEVFLLHYLLLRLLEFCMCNGVSIEGGSAPAQLVDDGE